jgi:hypothetical protein
VKAAILNPFVLAAIVLSLFTLICLVEFLIELSAPRDYLIAQSGLVVLLLVATSLCWRRGARTSPAVAWRHFFLRLLPIAIILYVIGYFALMDRHVPILTGPGGVVDHQSSFRFSPPMSPTSLRMVTVWNFLYDPMDALSFRFFPRSAEEVAELKREGLIYP